MKIDNNERVVSCRTATLVVRTADFQAGCIADFQARKLAVFGPPADWEIGDTAGLETCATYPKSNRQPRKPKSNRIKPNRLVPGPPWQRQSRLSPIMYSDSILCHPKSRLSKAIQSHSQKKSQALIKPKNIKILGKSAKTAAPSAFKNRVILCTNQTCYQLISHRAAVKGLTALPGWRDCRLWTVA